MTHFLNTTAIALGLAISVGTAWAQEAGPEDCDPEMLEFPCTLEGIVFEDEAALSVALETGLLPDSDADAQTDDAVEDETGEAAQETDLTADVEAEAQGAADAGSDVEVAAETGVEVEAEADAAVEAEADAAVEAEAKTEAETTTAETTDDGAEVASDAEADVSAQDTPESSDEAEAAEEAAPAEQAEAGGENDTAFDPATDEIADTGAGVDAVSEADAEADAQDAQGEATLTEDVAPTPEETVEVQTTTAAASDDAQSGDVTTQAVTDEDVRSADEDFETSAIRDAPAAQVDDSGLSDFERAVLIGLGAIAVGSILDNGDEVVSNSGDRIIVQGDDGQLRVLKDDDVLLRQPGSEVRVERFEDGSTRTFVAQPVGTEVVTIRSAEGRVLRRALVLQNGEQVTLFDDTVQEQSVDVSTLPQQSTDVPSSMVATEDELRAALSAELGVSLDRTFSLRQVRTIREVRELAPLVELDAVTFETGSAAIQPDQARELALLGQAIRSIIDDRPGQVFLIEGHTDAVGNAGYNLALSDRRAETVALALTEYFDVPAANLITQGYGETILKVRTLDAEEANRRATVRNVTDLLQ